MDDPTVLKAGIGVTNPLDVVFGAGPVGVDFEGAPVAVRNFVPRQGYNAYSFVQGAGVASLLLFLTVFVGNIGAPSR